MITREQKLVVKYYSYSVVNQESHKRYANNNEIDARVLSVFGDQIVKTAGIKGLFKKLKDLYKAFQKAPKLWTKFKQQLGIKGKNALTIYKELSEKLNEYLDEGKRLIDAKIKKIKDSSEIISFIFLYASKAPTLSSLLKKVIDALPKIESEKLKAFKDKMLGGIKNLKQWIIAFFRKHPILRVLSIPAKAYLYWLIWTHVAEISWKITDLLKGFLGMITWEELLESLPESGLGFLVNVFFPFIPNGAILSSLKIGWNALIIPAMAIQLYYLYKNNYISKSDLGL